MCAQVTTGNVLRKNIYAGGGGIAIAIPLSRKNPEAKTVAKLIVFEPESVHVWPGGTGGVQPKSSHWVLIVK